MTNAVKAKDSTVTVTAITKDSDGSYDVFGTRNGTPVKYDVSTDLKTITQDTNGPGGHGGPGDPGGVPGSAPSGEPGN